ncbi:MAG: hypothetical protein E7337_10235 [Clostridiales bacterium]|nr:hypothetical protein [Clostridiales bacterium]
MGIRGMVSHNYIMLVVLICVNFLCMSAGSLAWTVLGILVLAGVLVLTYRHGMAMGREACGILKTVGNTHIGDDPKKISSFDKKFISQAWSISNGVKGMLATAVVPYVLSCIYIVMMLLGDGTDIPTIIARVASWLFALPYWPVIAWKYTEFTVLEWPIVLVLMVSPFVLPGFTFLGYIQGPKLWKKTEEAMAQGKRRAKAKSRIVKKNKPREQKPEI